MRKLFVVAVICAGALAMAGCQVQRTIHIKSQPSGALVRLNDQEVGRTPVSVPFVFYGTYSVRLAKDGYQTVWTEKKTKQPFWDFPGIDIFALFVPGAKVDENWNFKLKKAAPPAKVNADILLGHARQMRALTEQKTK